MSELIERQLIGEICTEMFDVLKKRHVVLAEIFGDGVNGPLNVLANLIVNFVYESSLEGCFKRNMKEMTDNLQRCVNHIEGITACRKTQ